MKRAKFLSSILLLIAFSIAFSSCFMGNGHYAPGHYYQRTFWKGHSKYTNNYRNHGGQRNYFHGDHHWGKRFH